MVSLLSLIVLAQAWRLSWDSVWATGHYLSNVAFDPPEFHGVVFHIWNKDSVYHISVKHCSIYTESFCPFELGEIHTGSPDEDVKRQKWGEAKIIDPCNGGYTEEFLDTLSDGKEVYIRLHKRLTHPAIFVESNSPRITLFDNCVDVRNIREAMRQPCGPTNFFLPLRGKVVTKSAESVHSQEDKVYDISVDGPLDSGWLLVVFSQGGNKQRDFDMPILVVFSQKPMKIMQNGYDAIEKARKGLTFYFPEGVDYCLSIVPIEGSIGVGAKAVRKWIMEGLPPEILEKCRFWRRASLAIPIGREERFSLKGEWAILRWVYEYRLIDDEWGEKPLFLAPLAPTWLSLASKNLLVDGLTRILDTIWGPYMAKVGSRTLTVRLKLPSLNFPYDKGIKEPKTQKGKELLNKIREEVAEFVEGEEKAPPFPVSRGGGRSGYSSIVLLPYLDQPLREKVIEFCRSSLIHALRDENVRKLVVPKTKSWCYILCYYSWPPKGYPHRERWTLFDFRWYKGNLERFYKPDGSFDFETFNKLPIEVRQKILKECLYEGRSVEEACYFGDAEWDWQNARTLNAVALYGFYSQDWKFMRERWDIIIGALRFIAMFESHGWARYYPDAGLSWGSALYGLSKVAKALGDEESYEQILLLLAKWGVCAEAVFSCTDYLTRVFGSRPIYFPYAPEGKRFVQLPGRSDDPFLVCEFYDSFGPGFNTFQGRGLGGLHGLYWHPHPHAIFVLGQYVGEKIRQWEENMVAKLCPHWFKVYKGLPPTGVIPDRLDHWDDAVNHIPPRFVVRAIVLKEDWKKLDEYLTEFEHHPGAKVFLPYMRALLLWRMEGN
jgi:hypothetical protein